MKTVRSVMIVDDNSDDIYIARRVLQRSQRYTHIISVNDATDALARFKRYEQSRNQDPERFPPLIILLDINMPVLDGFEFLDQYTALPTSASRDAVVVMLTSSYSNSDKQRTLIYDAVRGFLTKPLTVAAATQLADRFGQLKGC